MPFDPLFLSLGRLWAPFESLWTPLGPFWDALGCHGGLLGCLKAHNIFENWTSNSKQMALLSATCVQKVASRNYSADPPDPADRREVRLGPQLATPLSLAPGARMTVVKHTPSKHIHTDVHCIYCAHCIHCIQCIQSFQCIQWKQHIQCLRCVQCIP